MPITHRELITNAGLALAVSALAPQNAIGRQTPIDGLEIRRLTVGARSIQSFPRYTHLAPCSIASHPRPMREATDANQSSRSTPPVFGIDSVVRLKRFADRYLTQNRREVLAEYVGGKAEEIALTGSTTMGLALVYVCRSNSARSC